MSINQIAPGYTAPAVCVSGYHDFCYVNDATGQHIALCPDFVIASTIRDALNRPYYEALETVRKLQQNAEFYAYQSRLDMPYALARISYQDTAAMLYAKARELLGNV